MTLKNIPLCAERSREGKYDLAYMNPYHHVVYHQEPNSKATTTEKDKLLQDIVVHEDSVINSLAKLQKADMAFAAPVSSAATIIIRENLAKMHIAITATLMELLRVLNFNPFVRPEGVEWNSNKDLEISSHLELPM
jgi:phosphonate transport system substrate-binding protein